jgi:type IV secretion system protein VirD4
MPTRAAQELAIQAPMQRIAELASAALARFDWRIVLINDALRQLTASQKSMQRVKGVNWNYEFSALITWQPNPSGSSVRIEVSEKLNTWATDDCRKKCSEVLAAIEENARTLIHVSKTEQTSTIHGSARWATDQDIIEAGYDCPPGDSTRLILGIGPQSCLLVSPSDSIKHALVCGPTGSGKTSSIFVPNLLTRIKSSAIVTEATAGNELPDLYRQTAHFRQTRGGQQIYYFNPDDLHSDRINPIDLVTSIDQAQNVANLIVQNTSKKFSGGDPIWETSERHLLTALILHVAGERGNLAMVRELMREGPSAMGEILHGSKNQAAKDEYEAFFRNSTDGFRNGVTSGLMQRLNLWVNPRIVALTETTDIDLESLSQQLFTFYMAVPAQKTHLKPLVALVFNFILDQALQRHFAHPLFLSLDEFTNFGYIPAIAEKLTIIRHRKIAAMIGIQDYVQMEKVYGREDASLLFGQPGTRIFFRPRDLVTAKRISDSLGQKTEVERKVTSSGQIVERQFGRPLLDPGAVMAIPDGVAITFTSATPPIMLQCFTWEDHKLATQNPPAKRRELQVDETLKKTSKHKNAIVEPTPVKVEEPAPGDLVFEFSLKDFPEGKTEKYTDGLEELFGEDEVDEPDVVIQEKEIPQPKREVEIPVKQKTAIEDEAKEVYDDAVKAEIERFLDDEAPP